MDEVSGANFGDGGAAPMEAVEFDSVVIFEALKD